EGRRRPVRLDDALQGADAVFGHVRRAAYQEGEPGRCPDEEGHEERDDPVAEHAGRVKPGRAAALDGQFGRAGSSTSTPRGRGCMFVEEQPTGAVGNVKRQASVRTAVHALHPGPLVAGGYQLGSRLTERERDELKGWRGPKRTRGIDRLAARLHGHVK